MRFWSKTKHSEKKLSREKQASLTEGGATHGKMLLNVPSEPPSRFISTNRHFDSMQNEIHYLI